MPPNHPQYVVRTEGHHPGYTDYVIISTAEGLAELAQALERLGRLPNGARIDFRIGNRALFGRDGHVAFAKCSSEKMQEIVHKSFRGRGMGLLTTLAFLIILGVGIWHTVVYLGRALSWLVGIL
jgi:hypothetical protein